MEPYEQKLSIKTWAEEDRPREKLLLKGKRALSDAELIAILIGSGNTEESAVELSKRIMAGVGNNLNELYKQSVNDLMKFKGIGEAKAISIVAALEVGARRQAADVVVKDKLVTSRDAFELLKPVLSGLPHEEFWVIYLNRSSKILAKEQISQGGIVGTVADTRIIFKKALETLATSIILAHNHPSGTLSPSKADIALTQKLKQGGELIDVQVLDHIIIGENGYYSFADEGAM